MKIEKELLFYDAYQDFYAMAGKSKAFCAFCKEAFGEDFSQDGFSDINQINMILQYIPQRGNVHILDIGCGNGKMLGYLQSKTGACIHVFCKRHGCFSGTDKEMVKERWSVFCRIPRG